MLQCPSPRILSIVIASAVFVVTGMTLAAQAQAQNAAARAEKPASDRETLLQWLDEYLSSPVLMKKEDVALLRQKIETMSPQALEKFLNDTRELRASIESDEWQETKAWLADFLKVQAIWSDEEIEEIGKSIPDMNDEELMDLMQKIRDKHRTLRWMHSTSDVHRKATVNITQGLQQQSAEARKMAARSSISRGGSGGTVTPRPHTSKGYRVPGPLIGRGVWRRGW